MKEETFPIQLRDVEVMRQAEKKNVDNVFDV